MGFTIVEKRYMGMVECSEYIGVTKGTLYVWVCHKRITYIKIGKLVKFDLREIDHWLQHRRIKEIQCL